MRTRGSLVVVEAEIFPNILNCLKDGDAFVRKNAATCIREVAKHTPELAKLIVNSGGAAALVDFVSEAQGNAKLPGIMAVGYIAAFSETLALAIIVSKGVAPLKEALVTEPEDHIKVRFFFLVPFRSDFFSFFGSVCPVFSFVYVKRFKKKI